MDAAATGSRIKQLRDSKGLTQMELADAAGVSMRTIGTWERTGKVPLEKLPQLTAALGQDPTRSLDGSAPVEPSEIVYRGWKFTFTPAPGATPEQVRRAEAAVLDTALAELRKLGLEDPA